MMNQKPMMYTFLVMMFVGFARMAAAESLTVEQAYSAIPHHRTVFDPSTARMNREETAYLVRLFEMVDEAIVAKMSFKRPDEMDAAYEKVWTAWKTLSPSAKLRPVQDEIAKAIHDQQHYLDALRRGGTWNTSDPRIQSSSQLLHKAYDDLMRIYPSEQAHNKAAFYDYLCALDFT